MGMFSDPMIIPFMFFLKGIMLNIYNCGIAFIYTFCSKEKLKLMFTTLVIITMIFAKLFGNIGTFLYNLTG
jgi:hypothetical protein